MEPDVDVREFNDFVTSEGGGAPEVISDEPEVITEEPAAPTAWRVARPRDGISLQRFLDRAKLSIPEAAALSSLVLDAVAAMHESGCGHGALGSRSARITDDGTVRLAEWGPDTPFPVGLDEEVRRADISGAAAIVEEITRSAGRPARPLTEAEERLCERLKANSDPVSLRRRGPHKAARGLEIALGGAQRREAAQQGVAELARAIFAPTRDGLGDGDGAGSGRGTSGMAGGVGFASGGRPPTIGKVSERKLPPPRRGPSLSPKVWKILAAVIVAVLLVGIELVFFGDSVRHNVKALTGATEGRPAAGGPRKPGPLPVLGPAAAGPITHVELRPLEGCRAEATCSAVVQLTVTPQNTPLDIAWDFGLVDRCGGLNETRPGGVMSVPPGQDRAVQTVSVPLPAGKALALVPVTHSPVTVAGVAMPLSGTNTTC